MWKVNRWQPKIRYGAIDNVCCPDCKSKGQIFEDFVNYEKVVVCNVCGSVFSNITVDKDNAVIKAIKIGNMKSRKEISDMSIGEDVTFEFDTYYQSLSKPIIFGRTQQ